MTTSPAANSDESLLTDLVAYLDGELEPQRARRVEQLLFSDPKVQEEVRKLEQSWELLDHLPQTVVSDNFARTTVELVLEDLSQQIQARQRSLPRGRRRWGLLLAGLMALGSFLTWVAVDSLWMNRETQFLQQLPVLEQLEKYEEAGSVEFLQEMVRRGQVPVPDPAVSPHRP